MLEIITDKIKLLSIQNNEKAIDELNECLRLFRVNLNVINAIEELPYDDSFTNITEHIYKMFVPMLMQIIMKHRLPMWSDDYAKLEWYRVLYFVYYCLHKIKLEGSPVCSVTFYTDGGVVYPIFDIKNLIIFVNTIYLLYRFNCISQNYITYFEQFINCLTNIVLDHESIEYIEIMNLIKLNGEIEYIKDKIKHIQNEYTYTLLQK